MRLNTGIMTEPVKVDAVASDSEGEPRGEDNVIEWMVQALQHMDIGVEVSEESLQTLSTYLESLMGRILEEAKAMNDQRELTSLDIHKAIKKLLPGNPGDPLRPYLPNKTKVAWSLDKQSLKGIKRKRQKSLATTKSDEVK